MKFHLNDSDMQRMSENLKATIKKYYKDDVDKVEDHVINTLCQNYVLDLKTKSHPDFEKLLNDGNFYDKT